MNNSDSIRTKWSMWTRLNIFLTVLLGFVTVLPAGAEEKQSSSVPVFDSFHLILDRNIFNPNRYRTERPQRDFRPQPSFEPERTDSIYLVGAMIYEGTGLAFFESDLPDFNRVLRRGDNVAGYRIVAVNTDSIHLEGEGQEMNLQVGASLKKMNDGNWEIVANSSPRARAPKTRQETTSGASPSQAQENSNDSSAGNDLLRKMMERRRQELGQ